MFENRPRKGYKKNLLNIRISDDLKKEFIEYCKINKITMSEFVGDYIKLTLNNYKQSLKNNNSSSV